MKSLTHFILALIFSTYSQASTTCSKNMLNESLKNLSNGCGGSNVDKASSRLKKLIDTQAKTKEVTQATSDLTIAINQSLSKNCHGQEKRQEFLSGVSQFVSLAPQMLVGPSTVVGMGALTEVMGKIIKMCLDEEILNKNFQCSEFIARKQSKEFINALAECSIPGGPLSSLDETYSSVGKVIEQIELDGEEKRTDCRP